MGSVVAETNNPYPTANKENETFDTALRKGKAKAILKVSSALMQQVEKGSLRGIIFYLKQRRMERGRA